MLSLHASLVYNISMKLFNTIKLMFTNLLGRPMRVLIICLILVMINMVFKGGFFELLNLKQNLSKIKAKKITLAKDIEKLEMKIIRASDPDFLELEVLNRFDLAQEGDLIFVFSDEGKKQN